MIDEAFWPIATYDAGHVLTLLVDDRVDRHGGLAGLAVADDQLALATADGHHRVDGLQAGLHRLVDGLAGDHARGDLLDHVGHLGVDRALAVDRLAQRVHHAADQLGADRHFQDAARALDGVAFGDVLVRAQDHGADRVALQVQRQTERSACRPAAAGNSSISPCIASDRPCTRTMPSDTDTTVPWLRMSALTRQGLRCGS